MGNIINRRCQKCGVPVEYYEGISNSKSCHHHTFDNIYSTECRDCDISSRGNCYHKWKWYFCQ